jgi:hypothetical protein
MSGKCIDSETLVPCDGKLIRMGKLCQGLEPGEQRDKPHFLTSLADTGDQFITAGASHIYRDPCQDGMSLVSKSGYELKCSAWHPIYSYSEGRFAYRTASELSALAQLNVPAWIPISRGYGEWSETSPLVLLFPTTNKSLIKHSKSHDAIASCVKEHGVTELKDIRRLTGIHYTTIRSFFEHRKQITQHSVILGEEVGYLLGLLVGDGCTTDSFLNANRIGFSSLDQELTDSIKKTLASHFQSEMHKSQARCDWEIRSDKLKSLVIFLGMNKYAHEKSIPDVVLESPRIVLRAFLQGLFDTDGCALKKGYVEYCSASERLAKDVHQLLLAFGIKSGIRFRKNKCRGAWHIVITADAPIFYDRVGFKLSRKQAGQSRFKRLFQTTRTNYPPDIKATMKLLYFSRHERGAPRGNLPRTNKHSGFGHKYDKGGAVSVETLARFIDFSYCHSNETINKFFIQGKVFWETIKSATPCKVSLFDFVVPTHHNFVAGGFINHNTVAALHKVARHLWETDRAEVAMMVRTVKSAKNSGVYEELCQTMIQWFRAGYFNGLDSKGEPRWIKPGPHTTDGSTKVAFFVVKNMHGTASRCSLLNCEDDVDAERKLKGTRFSMVYFPEITNFTSRIVFDATKVQMRCLHLKYEEHQFLADCNPAEEGEGSWVWKLWLQEKFLPPENDDQKQFRDELHSIHFEIADNPALDPREAADLRASYAYNKDLYDRYVRGLWTASTANSQFVDVLILNLHIVGETTSPNKDEWEMLVPWENTTDFISAWDPGDVNHSAHIFTKRIVGNAVTFDVLDELVFLKTRISIEDFTYLMVDKMDYWNNYMLREYGVKELNWRHWGDSSVFNFSSAANSYDALIIRNVSEGRINLLAANKAKGAVRLRVELLRKFLFQKRIFFSAQLFETIRMLKGLKRGPSNVNFIDPLDPLKHIFDSLTYGLMGEAPLDAQNRSRPKVEKRSSVVTVGV